MLRWIKPRYLELRVKSAPSNSKSCKAPTTAFLYLSWWTSPKPIEEDLSAPHLPFTSDLIISSSQFSAQQIFQFGYQVPKLLIREEIIIGITLGLAAGGLWKMHHWNEQRKTRAFYDLLEKGEISVVAAEE
ncbi:hypothetical protein Vadar_024035 [Vaccinium darrowii]|uniref:Uncharacterized protein n=1 Tax=Vaccinium darrowii TaxID=229202 RepID=A0ACB7XBW4_9ERIC|nr:hypothetical protein Vadar_024035 [Vaccinium darrowii]